MEKLDLTSLLNAAELNVEFFILATSVYARKYAGKNVEILRPQSSGRIVEYKSTTKISDNQVALRFLENFGSFISKLDCFDWDTKVFAYANRYCDTLASFSCYFFNSGDVYRPFYSVENVSLYSLATSLDGKYLRFNEIFPRLRSLSLLNILVINHGSLVLKYPHLEHFRMSFNQKFEDIKESLEGMIRLNPQIRSFVAMSNCSVQFLKFLSEHLPNLEDLEVWLLPATNFEDSIHFKNVKKLTVHPDLSIFPETIVFEQLQELEYKFWPSIPSEWFEFIQRHPSLIKLTLSNGTVDDSILAKLIGNLPNLEKASFNMKPSIEFLSIVQFLHRSPNLTILELLFEEEEQTKFKIKELQNHIKHEWNVKETSNGYCIEKQCQ